MTQPRVSIVVVSRGRASALGLCLTGISQLCYPNFEVIVVADPKGVETVQALPFIEQINVVPFDVANISEARNLGIAHAAGDIVAFIDDDAVPEPLWLDHLVQPFENSDVACVGGFVRGRNGISYQWTARSVDQTGLASPMDVDPVHPSIHEAPENGAIKTEGTNMALRWSVIADMGGFDPAFKFYLDETDVNIRVGRAGYKTAIVPLAEVHHGYRGNAMRTDARVPTDLFQIGASLSVFLRKYAPNDIHADTIAVARHSQRKRALRHLVAGHIEPRDVERLIKTFDLGVSDGQLRSIQTLPSLPRLKPVFRPFSVQKTQSHQVYSGTYYGRARLQQKATEAVALGRRVTAIELSRTALFHKISFTPSGYWLHRGGLFGRSERTDGLWRFWTRAARVHREVVRVANQRGIQIE